MEKEDNIKHIGKEDNCIYIGNKEFMNYVTGTVMRFTTGDAKEITIKARGKLISRAVDVAQVAVNKFLKDKIEIKDVKIGSEELENKMKKMVSVSFIEILIVKVG